MAKFNDPIENMQDKMKDVRALFNISVTKFADLLGVTRQTVYNIERKRTKMTKVQYLAMCALISELLESYPDKKKTMDAIWEKDYETKEKKKIQIRYI